MQFNFFKYLFFAGLLFFLSCSQREEKKVDFFSSLKKDTGIKYAKRFSISRNNKVTLVYLFGNGSNYDTTASYLIYTDASSIKNVPKNITLIKSPCKKIAALSSIYVNMFCELGLLDLVAAIDNVDYINNKDIISRCNSGQIKELSKGIELDLEQTIHLNPDIIFTFGMGDPKKDVNPKLLQTKIPIAISLDHKEETPLARAEWIKFFAVFVDKKDMADSIFKIVEKNYTELKAIAKKAESKPTVFNDIKYSDSWYMPGGKSYVAQMLDDAGANYLWKNDTNYGSLPLSFEKVYVKAKEADFWINQSTLKTKKELLSFDSRYNEFKAFKTGALFNNTLHANNKGYSTYWETGMIYPDRILSDLILIFHPELKADIKNDMYYYEQLK
ncbi:MAG: ABC transporter substrate-binding protein [Bacteroidetes bacterium]|nr:ABC transporter substrate-binding protein [Bacteroidota bacterium]